MGCAAGKGEMAQLQTKNAQLKKENTKLKEETAQLKRGESKTTKLKEENAQLQTENTKLKEEKAQLQESEDMFCNAIRDVTYMGEVKKRVRSQGLGSNERVAMRIPMRLLLSAPEDQDGFLAKVNERIRVQADLNRRLNEKHPASDVEFVALVPGLRVRLTDMEDGEEMTFTAKDINSSLVGEKGCQLRYAGGHWRIEEHTNCESTGRGLLARTKHESTLVNGFSPKCDSWVIPLQGWLSCGMSNEPHALNAEVVEFDESLSHTIEQLPFKWDRARLLAQINETEKLAAGKVREMERFLEERKQFLEEMNRSHDEFMEKMNRSHDEKFLNFRDRTVMEKELKLRELLVLAGPVLKDCQDMEAGTTCFFWFLKAAEVRAHTKSAILPPYQKLREQHPDWFELRKVTAKDVIQGKLWKLILVVSHRWEEPGNADPNGNQFDKIRAHLIENPQFELLWYDFWCLPQGNRSGDDLVIFEKCLPNVNLLYLSASVLLLVDMTYLGRFWTQFEAWMSMQEACTDGLKPASATSRFTIILMHNASKAIGDGLVEMWKDKAVTEVVGILEKPDVVVTNQGDKDVQLKKVGMLNGLIKGAYAAV